MSGNTKEYAREYYLANRDETLARVKNWQAENSEKRSEYMREFRKTHTKPPRTAEQREKDNAQKRNKYATDEAYREMIKAKGKLRFEKYPESILRGRIKKFGLSVEEYTDILNGQDGKCAICGATENIGFSSSRRLHIDHCHATGIVRGILCAFCNTGLGAFRDRPDLLKRAIEYLLEERTNGKLRGIVKTQPGGSGEHAGTPE